MVFSESDEQLHRFAVGGRSQPECCLAALIILGEPAGGSQVCKALIAAGLHESKGWNISRALHSARPRAILTNGLWSLTPSGKDWAKAEGLLSPSLTSTKVKDSLRSLLPKVAETETREFVEEAIACLEHGLRRSAAVMSWLAAVHVLKLHVFNEHRADFDADAKRVDSKWRTVKSLDDYGRMKESDFLDRIAAISVIGKNVKVELVECLNRRNSCGHPNSYKLGDATVAHHIEILLLNVFSKFI